MIVLVADSLNFTSSRSAMLNRFSGRPNNREITTIFR